MIGGVNFQPGSGFGGQTRKADSRAPEGVQEAIKVLSLRLPKVVGAQAVSPQALLTSQGSGGNPNVDSLVEKVLQRVFPSQTGGSPAPAAPMIPTAEPPPMQQEGPQFSGGYAPPPAPIPGTQPTPQAQPLVTKEPNFWELFPTITTPRVVADPNPVPRPGQPTPDSVFGPPQAPMLPSLRPSVEWAAPYEYPEQPLI